MKHYLLLLFLTLFFTKCIRKDQKFYSNELICTIVNSKEFKEYLHLDQNTTKDTILVIDSKEHFENTSFKCVGVNKQIYVRKNNTSSLYNQPLEIIIDEAKVKTSVYSISFKYGYEGIVGEADIIKTNGNYTLRSIQINEH